MTTGQPSRPQRSDNPTTTSPEALHPLDWARRFLPDYFSDPPADFHRELLGTLAAGRRLVACVAPRGHAKSTCAALAYPLWAVCTGRKKNIVIVTHEGSLARQFVRDIRIEIESNQALRDAYPEIRRTPDQNTSTIWRDDRITLNDFTVQARGTGASLRGTRVGPQRPDLIICDDIEKDRHVRSAEQRDALRHWLRRVAIPALAPDGQLLVLGSIIHYESLLAELRDRRRFPRWDYSIHRALEFEAGHDGSALRKPLWPARWSYARLMEERDRVGFTAFEQEYQANPVDSDLQVFQRAWLRRYDPVELVPERLVPLMAIDPATGIAGGDFFALWNGALDSATGVLYTFELTLERINIVDQVRRIISACKPHPPVRIGIEVVGYQKALKDALEDESRKQGFFLPVVGLQTHANKRARIEGIAPLVENGTLRFPHDLDDEVIRQFVQFPHARHDDAPDVCAMAIEIARTYRNTRVEILTRNQ